MFSSFLKYFQEDSNNKVDGATSLYSAAFMGNEQEVKRLIVAGAEVDKVSDNGMTPLYIAAYKGHAKVIELLAQNGANVNFAIGGHAPVLMAIHHMDWETFRALWGSQRVEPFCQGQPLIFIALGALYRAQNVTFDFQGGEDRFKGNLTRIIDQLIEDGQAMQEDEWGKTPLHVAGFYGDAAMFAKLVQAGGDPEKQDYDEITPNQRLAQRTQMLGQI